MHTLLLFLFSCFLCAPQQLASSKPFFSSNNNRRILNEPSFPPSEPPNQPPLPSIISSTTNPKHPFSTTTTTTTPNQSPFFPFYSSPSTPPPPPSPSYSTFVSFPANISSLVIPQSPKTKSSSGKLLSIAITAVACATVIAAVSAFVYCRRKRYVVTGNKTLSFESSISVFPPNAETTNGTRNLRHTSSTTTTNVINSRRIEDSDDCRKLDSPELQPLPRLAPRVASTQANVEHEEFYSPRGSSLGSNESSDGNGTSSPAIAAANFTGKSGELNSNSLLSSPEKAMHFGSLDQSPRMSSFSDRFKQPGLSSLSLSPTLLSSPEREFNESSNVANFVPQRTIDIGWASKISTQTKFSPAQPGSTFWPDRAGPGGLTPLPTGPSNRVPPPPPPPPPFQPQQKHWEVPTLSKDFGQPVFRPPELIPASRPFVLQNPTTKVFSHVELFPSSQDLRRNEKTLKPKLKALHWDKVRASSGREMVWDQMKSSSFKLNEEMIETLFVMKSKVNTPHSVLPQPSREERVLDPKKSQNIAILLRALNVTVVEVCEALLEGNADTLGTELLESLLKMAPSEEEEHKLKEHKDDSPTKLGPAEKFLKAVLDVPFAFKRVEAMLYIVNFESEVEYLSKSFQTLEAACEELRNCRMFSKLLEAVLKTGNRMNVGTNRGDAQAFKFDTLLKLADVKGADGKTTLLHFVVQEIIRTEGARLSGTNQTPSSTLNEDAKCMRLGLQVVSSLSSELPNVKKAAAMDSEILSSDVSKLTKGIAYIGEVAKTNVMEGSDESSKKFTESMNKFIRMAEEEIPKIEAQERVALSLVKEITEYFHGNLAKEEAHPFRIFNVVRNFLTVHDRVCREVGMINERTMVSSAHKFPVPVNPMLPQPLPGLHGRQQYPSSDDDSASSP